MKVYKLLVVGVSLFVVLTLAAKAQSTNALRATIHYTCKKDGQTKTTSKSNKDIIADCVGTNDSKTIKLYTVVYDLTADAILVVDTNGVAACDPIVSFSRDAGTEITLGNGKTERFTFMYRGDGAIGSAIIDGKTAASGTKYNGKFTFFEAGDGGTAQICNGTISTSKAFVPAGP